MAMYFYICNRKRRNKDESNDVNWNKTNGNDGYS